MINEQMVTRNGQKGFLDDKGNFYPIADMPADDAKVTPSNSSIKRSLTSTADQSGGLGSPDVQPPTSANANRDGSRGSGLTDAQIKALQDKANADRKAQQERGSYNSNPTVTPPVVPLEVEPAPTPTPTPVPTPTPAKTYKVDGEPMTAERIRQEYDKRRYNKDGTLKPLKDLGDASGFGDRANRAVFPNQRVTRRMKNAATGDYNPRTSTMNNEAYDVVLDYLLSEGHVDTVEEAHYVMLQMTSEHVQQVVEERTAADPGAKARMGYSNPAINGKPVLNPKGHPDAGKPMSFNKAETDGVNEYRRASKKAGRKIYADEPLPKK